MKTLLRTPYLEMARSVASRCVLLVLGCLLAGALPAGAGSLTEDFSTTAYKDTVNTTADWNTVAEELRLPPFAPSLLDSLDTPWRAENVLVHGDHLLVADLNSLIFMDIEDPENLSIVGSLAIPARDVAAAGNLAFVPSSTAGLHIVDISDPTNPLTVGTYNTPDIALGVALSGNTALVADRNNGLVTMDISDPTNPTLLGGFVTPLARSVSVNGDIACLGAASGLIVFDISDPANPDSIGAYSIPTSAYDVQIDDDRVFVAALTGGILAIDISDPTNPVLLDSYVSGTATSGVDVAGDRLYVGDYTNGIKVLDISNPANLTLLASYDTPSYSYGIDVAGDILYVGDLYSGVQVIRVGYSCPPLLSGGFNTPGTANAVALSGDLALVADGGALQILDISDPDAPSFLGSYASTALDVTVFGDHAILSAGTDGFKILDISDPTTPTLVSSVDTPGTVSQTIAAGDYLYVADRFSSLRVFDIGDLTAPAQAGSLMVSTNVATLELAGDYLFVGASFDGILVVDVSNPTAPSLVTNLGGLGGNLHIDGPSLFAAGSNSFGFRIYDISDPTAPSVVSTWGGFLPSGGARQDVVTAGNFAYVAHSDSGLQVVDISDLTAPVFLGSVDTPGLQGAINRHLAVAGHRVFKADAAAGLQVIRVFQDEAAADGNVGQSLAVDGLSDTIFYARLTSTETPGISWEVSADAGANWESILPDNAWLQFANPGDDLLWRTTHTWAGQNPAVSNLTLDWLNDHGNITTIHDIPNDQGRQVRVEWMRSAHDFLGDPQQIVEYAVYRKIDGGLASPGLTLSRATFDGLSPAAREHVLTTMAAGWDFVATVPVRVQDEYAVVVPTLADSTISGGQYYSTFMVSALTATPGVFFDSAPDSGYSVDNLAPGAPQGFAASYGGGAVNLSWDPAPEEDFQYFRVYRDTDPGFVPAPELIVQETASNSWQDSPVDPGSVYYKVTALDYSGNESDPTGTFAVTAVESGAPTPTVFALRSAAPNPVQAGTRIALDLPRESPVLLEVFDVKGRLVKTLARESMSAGRHEVSWDATNDSGQHVASGVYLYRLNAGSYSSSKRLVVIR